MKKTYIEPKNTVVALRTVNMISTSPVSGVSGVENFGGYRGGTESNSITEGCARESVSAPDAWEEW